ncbi:MAG: site-specific integrase, partial [Spirochaetales bacterium]|nr:site-specific integrase [Spirochaetales bacterium]
MILINDFSDYLKTTTVSENTVRAYVAGMRNYAGFFDEVNTENIRQYRHLCLQTQKPKTVNLRMHALVKYARWQQIDAKASLVEIQ